MIIILCVLLFVASGTSLICPGCQLEMKLAFIDGIKDRLCMEIKGRSTKMLFLKTLMSYIKE